MSKSLVAFAIPALALALLGSATLYKVEEGHQAIVLQLGKLVEVEKEPGLKFKIPFVQEVITYDKRILDFDMNEFILACPHCSGVVPGLCPVRHAATPRL